MLERMRPGLIDAIQQEQPDWVLVYGDTTSTLAGARAAKEAGVPLAHVESGMRSGDWSMPEEHIRVEVDRTSTLLLCPDERSAAQLRTEAVEGVIEVVGDVMADAALRFAPIARERSTVLDRLGQIRDIGVRLAIDDFGTGYSALSYLRHLPVDILKIDRSFIEGVVAGWQGKAFLHTIVRLTETLSMTAVGEGVETHEQLSALRALGCELGQGFLFARPMGPAEFSLALAEYRAASTVLAG